MLNRDEWEELRQKLDAELKPEVKKRRIKAIRVNSAYRWQPPLWIEVGHEVGYLEKDGPPELIVAIYESTTFLVVTPEHGYEEGLPHFFAKEDVHQVVPLED